MGKKNVSQTETVVTVEDVPLTFAERVDYANTIDDLNALLGEIKTSKDDASAFVAELQNAGMTAFAKIQSIQSATFNALAAEFGGMNGNHRSAVGSTGRTRTPASNIAIGASRMVTNAHLAGKTREEAMSSAMSRAKELAAGYSLADVPVETVACLTAKVESLYR